MTSARSRAPGPARYWDSRRQAWTVTVLAGAHYVTDRDEHLATVLGSCAAVCVRAPARGVGGMAHLLLVDAAGRRLLDALLDAVLAPGGSTAELEVKLFGGGRVLGGVPDIGADNIAAVRVALASRGIDLAAADVGGDTARRLRYEPHTGRTWVQRLSLAGCSPMEAP